MTIERITKPPFTDSNPQDWAQWIWYRVQTQPWVLGGAVVIAIFFLVFIALIIFAFAFGCCCTSGKRRGKVERNGVL